MPADSVLAILLLGIATYLTRIAGFLLIRRFRPTPFLEAWFAQVPGTVFVALVAPAVVAAGPPGWAGAVLAFLAMRRSGQFLLGLAAGLGGFVLLRLLLS